MAAAITVFFTLAQQKATGKRREEVKPPKPPKLSVEKGEPSEGLPLGVYLTWLKQELDSENACLQLPLTLVLLMSFSVLAYLHLRQADVFAVETAILSNIHDRMDFDWTTNAGNKAIDDVGKIADFWSWLRVGFLPVVVQQTWGYSEEIQLGGLGQINAQPELFRNASLLPTSFVLPELGRHGSPVRDDYLHYSRILGGIQMRQERPDKIGWDACRIPGSVSADLAKEWLGKPCAPADPAYELEPEVGDAEAFGTPSRVEWLHPRLFTLQELQMKVIDMEDGCSFLKRKMTPAAGEAAEAAQPGENGSRNGSNSSNSSNASEARKVGGDGTCLCRTCSEGRSSPGPWLDAETQRVQVGFVILNYVYGTYSLVTADFFFNRLGHVHKLVNVQTCWANPFHGSWLEVAIMVSCDLVWLCSLTYLLINEVREVISVANSSRERFWVSLWREYIDIWNVVDWISICVAYFVVVCWIRMFTAIVDVNHSLEGLIRMDANVVDRDAYTDSAAHFFELAEDMVAAEKLFRISFMFYPMVVMLRLFKSFHAQPRLAVVTRTLAGATTDMFHFFLVFFSCYVCIAVNAVLLFGRELENFANLSRAVITCFRGLFYDRDYESMAKVGQLPCAIWFWVFMLVLTLILLNILLAILMESYAHVKQHSRNELTLPKQISEMVRRYRQTQRKERVRLNEVWKAFFKAIGDEKDMVVSEPGPGFEAGVGGREVVTAEDVRERVYEFMRLEMPISQARRQFENVRNELRNKKQKHYTLEELHKEMARLDLLATDVEEQVNCFCNVMRRFDFDGDEDRIQQMVPEEPDEDCTEHKQLVADAVRDVVGQLSSEIAGTLAKEATIFEKRHRELEGSQREMTVCAKDACSALGRMRRKTDEILRALQEKALMRQRLTSQGEAPTGFAAVLGLGGGGGSASAGGPGLALAACGAPERGA